MFGAARFSFVLTGNQKVACFFMLDVFAAVGDRTRRGILERLRREGALSVSALAERLPMSRQAVTKHLDILEDVGLIQKHMRGRERLHVLCASPLCEINDWLSAYEAEWDDRLARLGSHLGEGDHGSGGEDG